MSLLFKCRIKDIKRHTLSQTTIHKTKANKNDLLLAKQKFFQKFKV